MSLTFNGNTVNTITFNGNEVALVYWDDTLVWPEGTVVYSGGSAANFIPTANRVAITLAEFSYGSSGTWTPQGSSVILNKAVNTWDDNVLRYTGNPGGMSSYNGEAGGIKATMSSNTTKPSTYYQTNAGHVLFISTKTGVFGSTSSDRKHLAIVNYTATDANMTFYVGATSTRYTRTSLTDTSIPIDGFLSSPIKTTGTTGSAMVDIPYMASLSSQSLVFLTSPLYSYVSSTTDKTFQINKITLA